MAEGTPRAGGGTGARLIRYELGANGFGRVTLESRGGVGMPLSLELLRELDRILAVIEETATAERLQLLVIDTAVPHAPLTGYDLEEIRTARRAGVVAWSRESQRILRRVEQLPVPTAAVIQGDWLGGAAELALACSHRLMASPDPRLALPQTRRGFMPAWGGTVRLPRLIGLPAALRLLLTDVEPGPEEALQTGLIDAVIPPEDFASTLDAQLHEIVSEAASGRRRRRSVRRRIFEDTAPGRRILIAQAERAYREEARSNIAGRVVLRLVAQTASLPLEEAFALESAAAGALIETTEARGRLHSERYSERAARRAPLARTDFDGAALLGTGDTAIELAHALVGGGTPVRIKGSREEARTAVTRVRERIGWDRRQGRISDAQAERRASRVAASTGYGGFGVIDAVIAAPEAADSEIGELLRQAERHVRDDCLLAFHSWTTPPVAVEAELRKPERLVRITCAPPLDRFPLLEIRSGSATSAAAVASARRLARRLSLTPLLLPGAGASPTARLLGVWLAEATWLLEEGFAVEAVDGAAEEFGFELPPFRRIDLLGSARLNALLEALVSGFGDRMRPSPLFVSVAREPGRFYRYRGGRPAGAHPGLPEVPSPNLDDPGLVIRRRLLLSLINEAARILDEGGVAEPGHIEAISVLGLGFPRERGGLLYYAQSLGLAGLLADLEQLAREVDPRFDVAPLIQRLAAKGQGFFPTTLATPAGQGPAPMLP